VVRGEISGAGRAERWEAGIGFDRETSVVDVEMERSEGSSQNLNQISVAFRGSLPAKVLSAGSNLFPFPAVR
jgi:hypothetical protein